MVEHPLLLRENEWERCLRLWRGEWIEEGRVKLEPTAELILFSDSVRPEYPIRYSVSDYLPAWESSITGDVGLNCDEGDISRKKSQSRGGVTGGLL